MGPLGWQETVFIFVLALLIFGPKKLPELGRTIGKALTEFRRASSDLKATFDREMSALERETESVSKEIGTTSTYEDSYNYDSSYDSSYYDGTSEPTTTPSDSTATDPSTTSASAVQGAESGNGTAPEGTVAQTEPAPAGVETAEGKPAES